MKNTTTKNQNIQKRLRKKKGSHPLLAGGSPEKKTGPGERPAVVKHAQSQMLCVPVDTLISETSQMGSLHSSFGHWKENSLPAKTAAAPNQPWQQQMTAATVANSFQNQTAAIQLSPLQIHHILIMNLQYCFTIKRSHCNTGAASRSHSLHGARPQDDTDTRS